MTAIEYSRQCFIPEHGEIQMKEMSRGKDAEGFRIAYIADCGLFGRSLNTKPFSAAGPYQRAHVHQYSWVK